MPDALFLKTEDQPTEEGMKIHCGVKMGFLRPEVLVLEDIDPDTRSRCPYLTEALHFLLELQDPQGRQLMMNISQSGRGISVDFDDKIRFGAARSDGRPPLYKGIVVLWEEVLAFCHDGQAVRKLIQEKLRIEGD